MRLVDTSTFELRSFLGQPPQYAILSHTWENEEVTFQELQDGCTIKLLKVVRRRIVRGEAFDGIGGIKSGLLKIVRCAIQASRDGFAYFWCDTCCIDKTNSTELSESINSMYHWYKDQHCYAYLSDISPSNPNFTKSRWFTRGWTLQELIAPSALLFFDKDWNLIGSKSEYQNVIAEDTGIDKGALCGYEPSRFSVATRMSWAARRKTTRTEDLAYCLMGLFEVNMPLIYGEKHKAFIRLQAEIMKASEDQSLFAWKTPVTNGDIFCGLLAPSPACFADSRTIGQLIPNNRIPPYSMTNRGIFIGLSMYELTQTSSPNSRYKGRIFFAQFPDHTNTSSLGIYLVRSEAGIYSRYYPHLLIALSEVQSNMKSLGERRIYVARNEFMCRESEAPLYRFKISDLPQELQKSRGFSLSVNPNEETSSWDRRSRTLCCSGGFGAAVRIAVPGDDKRGLVLLVGIDHELRARCAFADDEVASGISGHSFSSSDNFGSKKPLKQAHAPCQRLRSILKLSNKPGNSNVANVFSLYTIPEKKALPVLVVKELVIQTKRPIPKWDTWISQPERTMSGFLETGFWERVERPNAKFYQQKTAMIWKSTELEVTACIQEEKAEQLEEKMNGNDGRIFVVQITVHSARRSVYYR